MTHASSLGCFRAELLVIDFFGAGSETTATTLGWVLYFMMKHPDVQSKVRVRHAHTHTHTHRHTQAHAHTHTHTHTHGTRMGAGTEQE